jgi:hypothetical protein
VTYDRGERASGRPIGCVSFGRTRRGQLTEDLTLSRLRSYKPKRVIVGRVRAWYVCGHICGYDFRAQRLTYQAFGVYYARPGRERKDLRAIIRRLKRLPPPQP